MSGTTTHQIHNGRKVREVRILAENADGTVTVEALNGPMSGSSYQLDRAELACEHGNEHCGWWCEDPPDHRVPLDDVVSPSIEVLSLDLSEDRSAYHKPDPQQVSGRWRVDCSCGWRGPVVSLPGQGHEPWTVHFNEETPPLEVRDAQRVIDTLSQQLGLTEEGTDA